MRTLQDWVYEVEAGSARIWLVRLALFLFVAALAAWIGLREFNGLRTMEAMDLAQQGRQLALGKGFTTKMIRPLALWQLRAKHGNQAPVVNEFPETLTPPLYPLLLSGIFKLGQVSKLLNFEVPPEKVKAFRVYLPDYVPLILNLTAVVLTALFVFFWAAKQFDLGVGITAAIFFLGSSALWDLAIQGGSSPLLVFFYGLAGWLYCSVLRQMDNPDTGLGVGATHGVSFVCGLLLGMTPLIQVIHIWPCLAFVFFALVYLKKYSWSLILGATLPLGCFFVWLGKLWLTTGNPIGLNWAYFLADSPYYPGSMVWRTFSFDLERTDVWRRLLGSVLRGLGMVLQKGPILFGSTLAGLLAGVSLLHRFRLNSAGAGKNAWGFLALVLIVAGSFILRGEEQSGVAIFIVLLPVACVYGSAFLWICIERWKFEIDLVGKLLASSVALLACWSTLARLALPEPPPFSYPPNYPPIFIFMRSWFEPNELQASDLPWAEAWYSNVPTLWTPSTREDFLKIHDRVTPVFSILFTPMSSDVKMYSQMLTENSEWNSWVDLIRRQKPPDLPQAFATSLPPNNDYLLLSVQKRWN